LLAVIFVEIPQRPSTSPIFDKRGTFLERKICSPHGVPTRSSESARRPLAMTARSFVRNCSAISLGKRSKSVLPSA